MTDLDLCQLVLESVWVGRNGFSILHHLMCGGQGIQNVLEFISKLQKTNKTCLPCFHQLQYSNNIITYTLTALVNNC